MTAPPELLERLSGNFLAGDGCWEWIGAKCGPGYGGINWGGQSAYAHRAMYEAFVGPIPDGHDLDHTCHNADPTCRGGASCPHRRCVRPAHLRAVPRRENARAGSNALRVGHPCVNGHLIRLADDWYERPDGSGWKMCRECTRERERRRPKRPYDPAARHRSYLRKKAREREKAS